MHKDLPFGIKPNEIIKELPVRKGLTTKEALENIAFSLDEIFRLEDATVQNELLAQYYEAMQLNGRAENVRRCARSTFWNEYQNQKVYDLQKVFLCRDPFCINCQRYKSRTKVLHYSKTIELASEEYDLYLLTATQVNCTAENFKSVTWQTATAFSKFNNYLSGHTKIKGLDFSYLGYGGAIRAFEVTFTSIGYNPHNHVLIALSKDLFFKKDTYNMFSEQFKTVIDNGKRVRKKTMRKFCDFEILIQKIWYLLMNGETVTKKAIDNAVIHKDENGIVRGGYSCTLDKADSSSILEVFKYSVKSFGEDTMHMTQEQHSTLFHGLKKFRTIECYGIFRTLQEQENIDQQMIMSVYDSIIAALELTEKPTYNVYKSIFKVKQEIIDNNATYINRRAIFSNAFDTLEDMEKLVGDILHEYNKTHSKKISIDEFYQKIEYNRENREILFANLNQAKKDKQRKYTERSKARTRYAKEKLKAQGKSASDPRYAYDFLKAKAEYNNLHPLPGIDRTGENLPF